ncbi:MAG: putative metal-binding motif-containing protein [Deltaproteobacteria bacterium]|nr:putative metal-binding motif-containing protein [Deltaproteobacteria bacterium]
MRGWTIFLLVAPICTLAGTACVYDPSYEGLLCGPEQSCPPGYVCTGQGDKARCMPEGQDAGLVDGGGGDAGRDVDCPDPDSDQDGYRALRCGGDDCDDTNGQVHPGAAEICDGVDNDCDGRTDAADPELPIPACERELGVCAGAVKRAELCTAQGWLACDAADYGAHYEEVESSCDGLDNDCDGQTDVFTSPAPCSRQAGVCEGSGKRCEDGAWQTCTPEDYGEHYEEVESSCDGLDNDCDGLTDDMCTCAEGEQRYCAKQDGVCEGAMETCNEDGLWPGCDYAAYAPEDYEERETRCDGLDNDCDGRTDGQDPSDLPDVACEITQGVCAGATKNPGLCTAEGWQACTAADYGPYYGDEGDHCDDNRDNDCDGKTDKDDDECGCQKARLEHGLALGLVPLGWSFFRKRKGRSAG